MISAILYFLALGAFIGHSYIQIVLLKVFFFNKYFRARPPNGIHYREEEDKKTYKSLFYIHTASSVS